eukprot:498442_1
MANNTVRTVFVIVQLAFCFISVMYIFYLYKKCFELRDSIMIKKRHFSILQIQVVFIILWLAVAQPLMAVDFAILDQFQGQTQMIFSRLAGGIYPFAILGFFICQAWRFWHIYFDLKYSSSQKNSEWKY